MNYIMAPAFPKRFRRNKSLSPSAVLRKPEADEIINKIIAIYGISYYEIMGKCRKRDFVFPRQVCMWILARQKIMKLVDIGILFGGRDHTTAIHARETINDLMDSSREVRREIEEILKKIEPAAEIIHQ